MGGFMEKAIINEKLFIKVAFMQGPQFLGRPYKYIMRKYILGKNGNFSFSELSRESDMGQIFTSCNQNQCNVKFVYIA